LSSAELLDIAFHINGDMSARVMRVLADFTPDLEIYSIDEAFLRLSGFEHRLEAHARELRATVLQWTGIPVSVGIAPTKTLAKAANRKAKKDPASGGVALLLSADAQEAALAGMALTDLWGVADRMARWLEEIGIATPLDLRRADPRFIRERISVVIERMVHELRGTPCLGFEDVTPDRKSIMASRSFGRAVTLRDEMEEAVAAYTARAAEKMRRQNLTTASLQVFVHTNRFRIEDAQHFATQSVQLPVATADTGKLTSAALRGVGAIWKQDYRYKKAGVIFLDLRPATEGKPRPRKGLFSCNLRFSQTLPAL
jgi:DNA polymerase V